MTVLLVWRNDIDGGEAPLDLATCALNNGFALPILWLILGD